MLRAQEADELTTNGVVYWPVAMAIVLADAATKQMAEYALRPVGMPYPVVGDHVRFTLVYNPGAAFGLHLGPHSRWIFLALTGAVVAVICGGCIVRRAIATTSARSPRARVAAARSATRSTDCDRRTAWSTSSTSALRQRGGPRSILPTWP